MYREQMWLPCVCTRSSGYSRTLGALKPTYLQSALEETKTFAEDIILPHQTTVYFYFESGDCSVMIKCP